MKSETSECLSVDHYFSYVDICNCVLEKFKNSNDNNLFELSHQIPNVNFDAITESGEVEMSYFISPLLINFIQNNKLSLYLEFNFNFFDFKVSQLFGPLYTKSNLKKHRLYRIIYSENSLSSAVKYIIVPRTFNQQPMASIKIFDFETNYGNIPTSYSKSEISNYSSKNVKELNDFFIDSTITLNSQLNESRILISNYYLALEHEKEFTHEFRNSRSFKLTMFIRKIYYKLKLNYLI
jgi:hypothetical protein